MLLTTIYLLLISCCLFCIYDCFKPRHFPPGPAWLPIIGCLAAFKRLQIKYGFSHLAFKKLEEIYGPIVGLKLGRQKIVTISTYDFVKQALLQDEFNGRPESFFFKIRAFGKKKGVLFTEGQTWSQCRRFTMRHLRTFGLGQSMMNKRLTTEAQYLVENLREQSEHGSVLMHNAFDVAVINALWTMFAGHRFKYDDEKSKEILETVHNSFRLTDTMGGLLSHMPFLRFIAPKWCNYDETMSLLRKQWKFIEEEITKHELELTDKEPRDLIEAFLLEIASRKGNDSNGIFDRENLLILCLDLLLAGTKTTSDMLAITILFLSLNRQWIKPLQEELDKQTGRTRPPTFEDSSSLPMVEAFLAEVQRYLIMAPFGVPHKTMVDVDFNGYLIPKDTLILFDYYSVHYDPTYWDHPEEFRPQRFLDKNGQFCQSNANIPFGLGKRRCLGELLARSTFFLYFVYFIYYFNFDISPIHDIPDPSDCYDSFTLSPKPYYLKLSMRSDIKH
ncbi:methyl farnesoate epoxidase-like [Vespa crabro]|uniref:methyl farnesoate epoxidase-like n=1 Tax=Vespa crabro TaxID=7445 RepID=UPI001F005FFA|nr:methyl farnesoate epoxidase-like [Vespa crabro]